MSGNLCTAGIAFPFSSTLLYACFLPLCFMLIGLFICHFSSSYHSETKIAKERLKSFSC